jgi:hypothetical protein
VAAEYVFITVPSEEIPGTFVVALAPNAAGNPYPEELPAPAPWPPFEVANAVFP